MKLNVVSGSGIKPLLFISRKDYLQQSTFIGAFGVRVFFMLIWHIPLKGAIQNPNHLFLR